jgi:hypothetical protein
MPAALRVYLDALRSRARVHRAALAGLALTGLGGLALAGMLLVGWGVGGAGLGGVLVALLAAGLAGVLVVGVLGPLGERPGSPTSEAGRGGLSRDERIALLLPAPAREDVLSAVELCRRPAGFSAVLVRAQAGAAVAAVQRHPTRAVLPWSRLRRSAALSLAATLLGGAALAAFPADVARGAAALQPPLVHASTPTAFADAPIVGDISLEYVYPDYMAEPPRTVPSTSGDVAAPRGTVVRIRTRSLRPASSGTLLVEPGHAIRLRVEGGRRLEAQLVVTEPARWAFELRHADGAGFPGDRSAPGWGTVRERGWRTIRPEPDQPPIVTITSPDGDVDIEPGERVSLVYDVRDDHGLGDLSLVLKIGADPETRRFVRSFDPGLSSASGQVPVPLGELRVGPGEVVSVRLEALDRDTVSGPNRGASATVSIRIASATSRHRETLQRQRELLDLVVGALADRLERPVPDDLVVARVRERADIVAESLRRVTAWVGAHADDLRRDALLARDVAAQIVALRERVGELAAREGRMHGRDLAPRARRLEIDRAIVTELEDDALLLEDLLGRQRLDALADLGRRVDSARERLEKLLDRYAGARSEALRRELLREIAALEQEVRELRERLAELGRDVPREFLNPEAWDTIDLDTPLRQLRESLAADDVEGARAALERMRETMRGLMAALEGSSASFRGERFAEEERARSELLDRVGDLETRQRELQRLTLAVQDRYRRKLAERMRAEIDPLVQRLVARTKAAGAGIDRADAAGVQDYQAESLRRTRQRLRDLEASLNQGDLDESAQMAGHAVRELEDLDELLSPPRPRARGVASAVAAAVPELRAVRAELERALPSARQVLDGEDEERLRRQSSSQRALSEDAGRLARRIGRPDSGLSFVGRDAERLLDEARQRMDRAATELGRPAPREAHEAQESALERMRRLRETLEEAGRPQRIGDGGGFHTPPPVRIPGPDEHDSPREFRREVLDAMREQPPGDDAVRRYYEELVR